MKKQIIKFNNTNPISLCNECSITTDYVRYKEDDTLTLIDNNGDIPLYCEKCFEVHSIEKAKQFSFDLNGAVLASDAFFPFNDCVSMSHREGIHAFIQPGGSIRDKDSIDYCKEHGLAMVMTGMRHFRH